MNDLKPRILFWLAGSLIHFGIAESLQKKIDAEFIGLVDVDERPRKFFNAQDLVKFEKIYFYRDEINLFRPFTHDIKYLQDFEEKFDLNLWFIIFMERSFYKYNKYHKFTYEEILNIVEQECKFFEKILDETKPDFFFIGLTDLHHNHLLAEMCKKRNIKVFYLGSTRFGYRASINELEDQTNFVPNLKNDEKRSFTELQSYLKKFDSLKQSQMFAKKLRNRSRINKIKAFWKFFFIYDTKSYRNHFTRFGITRMELIKKIPFSYKKRKTAKYMTNHALRKIDDTIPFIYYPLHSEPERALSVTAPFFTNQIEVITHIAKSIPMGFKLLVKDHPTMGLKGGRTIEFYESIMSLPNVEILHPSFPRDEVLRKCSIVITVTGTSALEGAFFDKASIIMGDTPFEKISCVHKLEKINDLPKMIKKALKTKVNPSELYQFIQYIDNNSFDYNKADLNTDFYSRFYFRGFLTVEEEIDIEEMKKYLEKHQQTFEILAEEHFKKIQED